MSGQYEGAVPQFEIMEFGAGGSQQEAQMEQERAGRRGGARGGVSRPKGQPPVRRRYPRLAPWPAYPAVPWPLARSDEPPYAPDAGEPSPAPADEPLDDGDQGEVSDAELKVLSRFPRELCNYLKDLPDAQRPRYQFLGMLRNVASNPRAAGMAGLYLIVFATSGRKQAYNGMSDDLRQRLQAHVSCATRLGFKGHLNRHEVYFAKPPANARARGIELTINQHFLKFYPDVLTNQQPELEAELLGEAWP